MIATLPPGRARRSLRRDKGGAPGLAARWIAPGFVRIVDRYVELGPPDPGTFRDRMAGGPWLLSDAQARFVCLHRYDVR